MGIFYVYGRNARRQAHAQVNEFLYGPTGPIGIYRGKMAAAVGLQQGPYKSPYRQKKDIRSRNRV